MKWIICVCICVLLYMMGFCVHFECVCVRVCDYAQVRHLKQHPHSPMHALTNTQVYQTPRKKSPVFQLKKRMTSASCCPLSTRHTGLLARLTTRTQLYKRLTLERMMMPGLGKDKHTDKILILCLPIFSTESLV